MRSAEVWTSSTVALIEPLASTVWLVACWMAVILAVMSSVARAVWAGEALHFLGDDREAAAGIAGAGGLDGRVERQQVGLAGDVADQAEDRFDRLDVGRQRLADLRPPGSAWSPARVATPAATSTSVRASSIARIRPAAVCAASRIATADCSAAAATSLVLPSMPRADAAVERVRSVSAFDWSLLARTRSATRRSNSPLSLAARSAASIGLEQRDLGEDDVGFVAGQPLERGDASRLSVSRVVRRTARTGGDDGADQLVALGDVGRDRDLLAKDAAAIFGDRLDPGGIDRRV